MLRLSIVIADTDEKYLQGLAGYLMDHLSNRFLVHSFSKKEVFQEYIEKNAKNTDVVLVSPEVYFQGLDSLGIKLACMLSEGKLPQEYPGFFILDKYILADEIAQKVIAWYAQKNPVILEETENKGSTKVFAVYSPLSGCGKSTIAYGLALKAAQLGKTVFYLNLEENPTTEAFFNTEAQEDLSHVLFYLKAHTKNISVKLDSVKQIDGQTGIHFFNPPKSNLELEDVTPKEYISLLRTLKHSGIYDYVIVDLSSGFSAKIAAALAEAEKIVFPITDSYALQAKTRAIIKDFEILYARERMNLYNKLFIIENKVHRTSTRLQNFVIGTNRMLHSLPYEEVLFLQQAEKHMLHINTPFVSALDSLLLKLG